MTEDSFGALLAERAFMRIWGARLLSTAGSQMLMVAIGWQMYELTGSAWDLGLIGLFQFAPVLVFTLVAGHAADRYDRVGIVTIAVAMQIACCGVLLAATLFDSLSPSLLIAVS